MESESEARLAPELDEASRVARAQDGDTDVFEELILSYQDRLFRLAFRMLNDRSRAEDVVQDVLLASWRRLPLLHDINTFGGWIYKITTNRCLDILRKQTRHPEDVTDPEDMPSSAVGTGRETPMEFDPVRTMEHEVMAQSLGEALKSISPEQRACWLLREVHGRSYAEIGATLDIKPTAVRGRLARAREEIAGRMSPWR